MQLANHLYLSRVDTRLLGSWNVFAPIELTSYDTSFNCTQMNEYFQQTWNNNRYLGSFDYTCKVLNSTGHNIAPEWSLDRSTGKESESKSKSSSNQGLIGVVVSACIVAIVIVVAIFWLRARRNARNRARQAQVLGDAGGAELVDRRRRRIGLLRGGVVRANTEGEQPPVYEEVGKPGEVPPQYCEFSHVEVSWFFGCNSANIPRSGGC